MSIKENRASNDNESSPNSNDVKASMGIEQTAIKSALKVQTDKASNSSNLKSVWNSWGISFSKSIQPLLKEFGSFAIYITADLIVIWLLHLAVNEIANPVLKGIIGFLYDGLKFISFVVICFHFVCNCIVEINNYRKDFLSGLSKEDNGKEN